MLLFRLPVYGVDWPNVNLRKEIGKGRRPEQVDPWPYSKPYASAHLCKLLDVVQSPAVAG